MRVELLIYLYGSVCMSMIVFNCICIFVFKRRNIRLNKKSKTLEKKIEVQIKKITEGKKVEEKHFRYLNRKLSRIGNLMAFYEFISKLIKKEEDLALCYLYEIRFVFFNLAIVYLKKEAVQRAYFVFILGKFKICRYMPYDSFMDIIEEYLKEDNLYCRTNAMKTLYSFGDEKYVLKGIKILDQSHNFFHSKILSDGLLTFEGDHHKLIELLLENFEEFTVKMQLTILNYIRFQSGEYCEKMLEILKDDTYDSELHYAAIRYFGKYYYKPAWSILMEFVSNTDALQWNYAAFSATALANYPDQKTVEVLKIALASSNWYVRYNAANSIDSLGISYYDLIDIMNGTDRYAHEILNYRLESRKLKEQEMEELLYDDG